MIINVYKPINWTSFDVVAKARKILGIKKIGHGGTLDPLAEGVLILLTDKDTKKQLEIMKLPKKYYFEAILGAETPSGDLESEPVLRIVPDSSEVKAKLSGIIDKYTGEFEQTVPLYSAKKVNGKRLYKLARAQVELQQELPKNTITVYEFQDVELVQDSICIGGNNICLPILKASIFCSSGTYVRSLVMDIGNDLGCGAVAKKIIRTAVGPYSLDQTIKLEDLKS